MSKIINDRCPLQSECERKKCDFLFNEAKCPYYYANIRDGAEIEGQSTADFYDIFDDDEENLLEYIPIDELYPHPDNPRKDLGDLTELIDSIKENGVLQNLLVVPGHKQTHEEWKALAEQYNENPTAELQRKMNNKDCKDGYTVLIGHRRLAAAKEAGLTELPCVIKEDMDKPTQIAVMILENGQRKDLSVYEQANAVQMLLDLGDSVNDIAKKTGFSETTIRRRQKLLDLDQEKFRASSERGATLADYVKLEQIEDMDLKNEVLETIGTTDFNWKLNNAINTEATKKRKARWIEIFNSFATKVKNKNDYKTVGWCHYMGNDPETSFTIPKDAHEVAYFYYVENNNYIYLLKEKEDEASDPAAEKKAKKENAKIKRLAKLDELNATAMKTRRVFVQNYTGKKEDLPELVKFLTYATVGSYSTVDKNNLADLLSIEVEKDVNLCDTPKYVELCENHPYAAILTLLFAKFDGNTTKPYNFDGEYKKNPGLERWYSLLEKFGYPISEEEQQLLDGTHELYPKTTE